MTLPAAAVVSTVTGTTIETDQSPHSYFIFNLGDGGEPKKYDLDF